MAKSKQLQEPKKSDLDRETDRIMLEMKSKDQKQRFDKKVEDIAQRCADYIDMYGEEDYRSSMMMSFLDVALLMKESIVMITDMKDAIKCMTDAAECIDGVYEELFTSFEGTLEKNYGPFARMRQRRKLRKTLNNNIGRMISMTDAIVGGHKMAMSMVSSMQNMSLKLTNRVNKMNKQNQRKNEKSANAGVTVPTESAGKKVVDEILKNRKAGDGAPFSNGGTNPTPTAPTTGADVKPSGGGYDDIL